MIESQSPYDDEVPETASVPVTETDLRGTVFIIPVDAPLPSELADVEVPKGSLYTRIAALANPAPTEGYAFVPVSGAELLALERSWRLLQTVKRVSALFELPGARYDVLFTQAVRAIGLPRVEWTQVAQGMTERLRSEQRTRDTTPWQLKEPLVKQKPASRVPGSTTSRGPSLAEPPAGVDDADQ